MNPIAISLGKFEIRWYTLFIIIAFLIVSFLVFKEAKKFNFSKDFMFNLIFWIIIIGFLGARIYYVLFNWNYYSNHLDEIIKIWQGGLAIHGGLIAGTFTIFVYAKKYKVNFLKLLDIICVPLLLGQAIGRWGNFFNSEAHGAATTIQVLQSFHIPKFIINGMNIDGIYYHPTFFYESILCLIAFIVLFFIRRFKYIKIGQTTALYLIFYGIIRFFIESSRTDSLIFFGFKAAQVISIIMIILGLILFFALYRKSKFENLYNEVNEEQINF